MKHESPTPTFALLGINPELAGALSREGYVTPTPVQQETIPPILSGQDVIAQAQTGTGKTLAFVLPILERINPHKPTTQALVLTPTRELAIQIAEEVKRWAPLKGIRVLAAYGGQDVERQIRKLEGAVHLIIATPGRLLDHIRRETVQLHTIQTLVLDEADQMLHMGFLNEVHDIIRHCATQRQTLLFSATMPGPVRELAKGYMRHPLEIKIKSRAVTLDEIEQLVIRTSDRGRFGALTRLIEEQRPYLAMIFCRTKLRASKLADELNEQGYAVDELHGDLTQAKREQVMKRFREAKIQILVATDIAARGLDVEGITHVFNYDMPQDTEAYIHRIGRTGRAGQRGTAITFVAQRDLAKLESLERGLKAQLPKRTIDGGTREREDADGRGREASAGGRGREARGRGQAGRGRTAAGERRGSGRGEQRHADAGGAAGGGGGWAFSRRGGASPGGAASRRGGQAATSGGRGHSGNGGPAGGAQARSAKSPGGAGGTAGRGRASGKPGAAGGRGRTRGR